MEVWDIVDINRNKTGKKHIRGDKLLPGEYHEVVHIWFKNSKGLYLIQQRAFTKKGLPGVWAATGGAVVSGETSLIGAIREVEEEIGIKLTVEDLNLLFVREPSKNHCSFSDIYLVEKDIKLEDCILDKEEVEKVAYFTRDEIYEMVNNNTFWDYGNEYFKKVFEED